MILDNQYHLINLLFNIHFGGYNYILDYTVSLLSTIIVNTTILKNLQLLTVDFFNTQNSIKPFALTKKTGVD